MFPRDVYNKQKYSTVTNKYSNLQVKTCLYY